MAGEVRYYTLEDAARKLRLSPERVRQMLEDGEIEGMRTGDAGGWRVPLRGDPSVPPPDDTPPPVFDDPEPAPSDATPAEVGRSAEQTPPEPTTGQDETRELPVESDEPGLPATEPEEARQPTDLPRGDDAEVTPEVTSVSGWVSTQQAAKALGISARTVRWHIERGNLDAKPEGEGVERTWRVSVDSLQALRDSRQSAAPSPRASRAPDIAADVAASDPGNAIRALADRLVEEARRAEAARVRLELSERAQSTLEAELSEERRRREEAEHQRREAEMERDAARRELEALERSREVAPQPPPSPSPSSTPPETRDAPQSDVKPHSEESVDTAAAVEGPLRPPDGAQEPSPQVQPLPVQRRRGLFRRIFRG